MYIKIQGLVLPVRCGFPAFGCDLPDSEKGLGTLARGLYYVEM
jgi:hypothetical protein